MRQNRDVREALEKSLNEMKELKKFQGSTFDTIVRRRLIGDLDTILELTGKIQELQSEIYFMNDSRGFKDQFAVDNPTLPVKQRLSHLIQTLTERSLGMPSRNGGPPSIWDTHGVSGNVFANPTSFFQHLIRKSRTHGAPLYQNTHHHM